VVITTLVIHQLQIQEAIDGERIEIGKRKEKHNMLEKHKGTKMEQVLDHFSSELGKFERKLPYIIIGMVLLIISVGIGIGMGIGSLIFG